MKPRKSTAGAVTKPYNFLADTYVPFILMKPCKVFSTRESGNGSEWK